MSKKSKFIALPGGTIVNRKKIIKLFKCTDGGKPTIEVYHKGSGTANSSTSKFDTFVERDAAMAKLKIALGITEDLWT